MRKNKKAVELELRDAFGNSYFVNALPREEIEDVLAKLSIEEVVEEAYRHRVAGMCNGIAQLDVRSGKLTGGSYSTGEGDIEGAHYIDLYFLPQYLDVRGEDILNPDELKRYHSSNEGLADFCELEGIDYAERELEALIFNASESKDFWDEIGEELNRIYLRGDYEEWSGDVYGN